MHPEFQLEERRKFDRLLGEKQVRARQQRRAQMRKLIFIGLQLFALAFVLYLVAPAHASQTIQFPEEELASESVLPIFDQPVSVKLRSVATEGRLELGPVGGYSLTEPFFNPMTLGATVSYHFNEESALNFFGLYYLGGLADNGKKLNPIPDSGPPPINANLQYAPQPKYLLLANYQFTAFYGKISLTKNYIMNLGLYGLAGVGLIGIGDAAKPVVSAGIGQKFYLTDKIALRFDLRFLAYSGPDILSRRLDAVTSVQSASTFSNKLYFSGLLTVGAIFLLPQL